MCIDMCTDMCIDRCIDMCIDTCIDMGIDRCIDMCIAMCIDLCTECVLLQADERLHSCTHFHALCYTAGAVHEILLLSLHTCPCTEGGGERPAAQAGRRDVKAV